ncbi:hypothetical protein K437DRAFT_254733 [Tilletiaria anomala UBC 951]|uniref:Uncharacterized protein n=1 Tax=Tilletiaria anomala (strain ATCC 24038 / CBS 436.72 / UBC 951) TaxID=1037660 RepID=A0A066WLX4_TILAU|nr:uncharacterized protein K437DRAFT_254733 [Tilletiaria anomala UBC 951]KDN51994.1 hypothetical protein K437DRAFT_254733 [Tilletiaria anomala UBC 951]
MSSADAYAQKAQGLRRGSGSGQSQSATYYANNISGSSNNINTRGSQYGSQRGSILMPSTSAPRLANNANAWGPDAEESEDEEEDWNIYDDFNNVRPLSSAPEAAGLSSTDYQRRASQELVRTLGSTGRAYSSSTIGSPFHEDEKRTSLLPSSAFGFDVQNGDPRFSHPKRASQLASGEDKGIMTPSNEERNPFTQTTLHSGIELVTVPALGQEFTEEERRKMTRPYKRKSKRGAKKAKFMIWARGEKKVLGFLDPRMLVFIAFFFCIILGLALFFVIPRVPTFQFLTDKPFDAVPDGSGMSIGYSPAANFSMDMKANLRADNTAGWIPLTLTDIKVTVNNVNTYIKVGEGTIDKYVFPGRKKTTFQLPVSFSYRSLNQSGDATWQSFHRACGPIYPNSPRPYLNLELTLDFNVQGLIGRKGASTQLPNIVCPFELQPTQ